MEGEEKAERERRARLQKGSEIYLVHGGLPQEESIFPNMQHNQQPDSHRRRLSYENLLGMYSMSGTQLLAQANNNSVVTSSSVGAASSSSSLSSQYSMDSWTNSWKIESGPWIFNPGSSLGINTGIARESTMQKPQYVSTPQKIIFDLTLRPEEMASTSLQTTEPKFQEPVKKSILQTGYLAGVKKDIRARDDEKLQLKTPSLKRKTIRPRVVREEKTNKAQAASSKAGIKNSSAAAATATNTCEESSYFRPQRACRSSKRLDFDLTDDDENCGHKGVSSGGDEEPDTTFGNIPRTKGQRRTNPSPQEDLPSNSRIFQCYIRKRFRGVTRVPDLKAIVSKIQPTEPKFQEPQEPVKKSILETGSPAGVKKDNRARDGEKIQLKTPSLKRKKIRPRVVREEKTNKAKAASSKAGIKNSSAAAATDTNTCEESSYFRPKRACRSSKRLDFDLTDDGENCGLSRTGFSSGGDEVPDTTFGNIPMRKGQRRINPSSQEDLPSNSRIFQCYRRKRFRGVTRVPDLKAIVSQTVSRKKRSQRDHIASRMNARVLGLRWRRQHPTGPSLAELWERSLRMDALSEVFKKLNINREGPFIPHNTETAILLQQKACQEELSIVKQSMKKQKPKVHLDPETNRVWKLLMLSSDSDGIDGSDEEKRKWWEEERNLFHGRANSFIARMRLVQGDRTFSPWKGSVVDSVVGVFLTQNVADHTSSSAYIDLAAEFPVDWNVNKISCLQEGGSSVMNLDPRNGDSTPRISNPTRVIIEEMDDDDDEDVTDAVRSQGSSKTSESSISSEQVDSQMETGHKGLSQVISVVSSTSTQWELNRNEVATPQVENCDAFQNKAKEDSQVQHMLCSHQQELEISTIQTQDQQQNTRTKDVKNNINTKKPTTSRPPKNNKPKESTKKKSKEPATKSNPKDSFDWDSLRKQAESGSEKKVRPEGSMDTVDWDALRCTNVHKIADIIKKRGMNNMLAKKIKAFLNRLVLEHGSIDLEWLRDIPPDKAKEYLLSIDGLGLKSVECIRLLSLHQVAFPVDTNVGRIAVRLGWVPLQPLPDQLQMHLLELYPVLDSVQKYLWPRLCKFDPKTLYELHYHMITFGKVFCTKVKPNCNACPMKAQCRHYASAHASARLALPEPEESQSTTVMVHKRKPFVVKFRQTLYIFQEKEQNCEPIIEEPASPEPEYTVHDIEDFPWDNKKAEISTLFESGTSSRDPWESKDVIPTIMLHKKAGISQDLVVLSTQETLISRPKLKTKERLRTEHLVYELPDYHYILKGYERREDEDKLPYLLTIWTPGETINSIQPPTQRCVSQGNKTLCHEKKCFECNKIREEESQTVRGTILIPCRTAMRGGFPLNGTYFQTNEVFADHGSSINPIDVPRQLIWDLRTSTAYFGSSVSAICKGLPVEDIRDSFGKGYVCVRGFDREKRTSEDLVKRLHCSQSKPEASGRKRKRSRLH